MVRIPIDSRSAVVTRPAPHRRDTGRGARKSASPPGATTTRPSGFSRSDATLAMNLFEATPTEAARPIAVRIRDLMRRACSSPSPNRARVFVTSRNASSMESGSRSGVNSARMAMISRETRAYFSMSTGRNTPSGQSRRARATGIADPTPNFRAS